MNISTVKFEVPGMGNTVKELYSALYGEDIGKRFVDVLATSPDEIAVISRLIAYLMTSKKGEDKMDMQKTAREIGLFETAVNLVAVCDSSDVQTKVGASMPLPDANITKNIKFIAEWLVSFGKKKYLFMTPEIALVEAMAKLVDHDTEIIFIIPCDMDLETKERLKNNLPNQLKVSVLEEPYFPGNFFPGNG